MELTLVQKIAVWALPVLFAITLHEVAHGWVALVCGDRTAKFTGRLTLNPLKHIDPFGTVILPALFLLLGSNFIFGWAKPVPVDARNLHHPRRDLALVAAAGPLANIAMAIAWALAVKAGVWLSYQNHDWFGQPLQYMGSAGILINIVLAVLNLVPLPPLDGGKFLMSVLPPRLSYQLQGVEPYSFLILLLLLVTGVLSQLMTPIVSLLLQLIAGLI